MKALSFIDTPNTVIVKLDTGVVVEFGKTATNGINSVAISSLSVEQFDLLDPLTDLTIDVMAVIENNRNAFDSLFSNL
jgi:hypothetical protein